MDAGSGFRAADTLERYLALHAAAETASVLTLFAADARLEDPVGSPPILGRDAIADFYRTTHARNGRLVFERIGRVVGGPDEIAAHVRARFETNAPATAMDVIYTLRIDAAGRIVSLRAFF